MSTLEDLRQFHEFVGRQLSTSDPVMTPEECLDAWRNRALTFELSAASVADLQAAIADMERGDHGVPAREHVRNLRQQLGMAKSP